MANPTSSVRQHNVSDEARVVSAVAGSLLLYFVAKRHKTESLLLLGGSYLLYRAISGHCPVASVLKSADRRSTPAANINIRTHLIVDRPRAAGHALWRRLG